MCIRDSEAIKQAKITKCSKAGSAAAWQLEVCSTFCPLSEFLFSFLIICIKSVWICNFNNRHKFKVCDLMTRILKTHFQIPAIWFKITLLVNHVELEYND
jgi:hypothetical protein